MRGWAVAIFLPACTVLTDLDSLRTGNPSDAAVDSSASDVISITETGSDAPPDSPTNKVWVDTFDRPDSMQIGNGWIMKTAGSHDITNNRARNRQPNTDYKDNVVYRPALEDVRDVTISVEFSVTALPPGYPQIMTRIVQSTVMMPTAFDGYIFFLPNVANQAVIGRQRGTPYLTQLKTIALAQSIDTSHTYRLTFTTSGANPVSLTGVVEVENGNTWMSIGSATYSDSDTARLDAAGAVGFGSSGDEVPGLYSYDNFTRTSL